MIKSIAKSHQKKNIRISRMRENEGWGRSGPSLAVKILSFE